MGLFSLGTKVGCINGVGFGSTELRNLWGILSSVPYKSTSQNILLSLLLLLL